MALCQRFHRSLYGSDGLANGCSWTRFWLSGTLPVARAGGDDNHLRASFGSYLGVFQHFEGFTLPTKVEAGNHFGTEAYFPLFRVRAVRRFCLVVPTFPLGCVDSRHDA